jgi:hypothetical protein
MLPLPQSFQHAAELVCVQLWRPAVGLRALRFLLACCARMCRRCPARHCRAASLDTQGPRCGRLHPATPLPACCKRRECRQLRYSPTPGDSVTGHGGEQLIMCSQGIGQTGVAAPSAEPRCAAVAARLAPHFAAATMPSFASAASEESGTPQCEPKSSRRTGWAPPHSCRLFSTGLPHPPTRSCVCTHLQRRRKALPAAACRWCRRPGGARWPPSC